MLYFDKKPKDLNLEESAMLVGMAKNPQVFLKSGDKMELKIDNLGTQNQKVVSS